MSNIFCVVLFTVITSHMTDVMFVNLSLKSQSQFISTKVKSTLVPKRVEKVADV